MRITCRHYASASDVLAKANLMNQVIDGLSASSLEEELLSEPQGSIGGKEMYIYHSFALSSGCGDCSVRCDASISIRGHVQQPEDVSQEVKRSVSPKSDSEASIDGLVTATTSNVAGL
ncbi:unnamed protein product [Hydatigera taeniaeformis]|uniref:Uncharacterized protein n=1 Tax=Hydatigena taeniaeformis TaxID=6205 RepID=A0A0R3X3J2_HYDTA|nr:unnamed protein product [Hydatigera taeniaeformis]